jgi:phosphonate transport system substrate-binding protein
MPCRAVARRTVLRLMLVCLAAAPLALRAAPGAQPAPSYTLGIFPYLAPRQTLEFYGPLALAMVAALGHPVRLMSVPSFPDFSRAMAEQRYDIALVQPFDYLEAIEKQGYVPLARLAVPLVTQVFVRDDSRYRSLDDLRGTTVAMPPPQTANARMTLRALHDQGLVPGRDLQLRYFNSHDSCIQQVWAGTASACGTARPPIQIFERRMQAKLRPIFDTPPIPHVVFVAHTRVPAAARAKLRSLLLGLHETEQGRGVLKGLGFPGFAEPDPAEYEMLRHYDPLAGLAVADRPLGNELMLGVFPFLASRQLAENFAPTLPRLSQAADLPVQLRTASSFGGFIEALSRKAYDIVLVQPFDYGVATDHGYLPLAGMQARVRGSFFVRADSPYHRLSDLKGQVIAMPPPDAAQSRLALRALVAAGLVPGRDLTVDHRGTHDSCLNQVQLGLAAACATAPNTLIMVPTELARGLRPVGRSDEIPGLLFMAQARVPEALRRRLAAELIGWKDSEEGRAILTKTGLGALAAVDVRAYERLQETDGGR